MIQAKLYQIPCLETGKFAVHAEQITPGADERQLSGSSCGLELGLSPAGLAQGGQGTNWDRKVPSKPALPSFPIVQSQPGLVGSPEWRHSDRMGEAGVRSQINEPFTN